MKQKYIIRETSVPYDPPYTPLYFHGFTSRGAGVCMVFGHKLAAEFDTLEAVNQVLVKVKELSGRDTWDLDVMVRPAAKRFESQNIASFYCKNCKGHINDHHGEFWQFCEKQGNI